MGIVASDLLIKTMIEASLADLRKNTWILDDVFGELAQDHLNKIDYGYKEVQQAKEWFLANQIEVYLTNRLDTPRFPCITVVQTDSREMIERASLGDEGYEEEETEPKSITKRIQKVVQDFTPVKYDKAEGIVTMPEKLNTDQVAAGMFLVSKKSGKAYGIKKLLGTRDFQIMKDVNDDFLDCYIAPATSLWNLKKEMIILKEAFSIGLHAQSDINQAIWLRQLGQYIFLRYKEAFLERRGFELSTFSAGMIQPNPHFDGQEKVYSCPITMNGDVEAQFIKYAAPKLAKVGGGIKIMDGPRTPDQYRDQVLNQGWSMVKDHETDPEPVQDTEQKDDE